MTDAAAEAVAGDEGEGDAAPGEEEEGAAGKDNEVQRHLHCEGRVDGNASFVGSLEKIKQQENVNQNTQEVKNDCFLKWTRQNKVQIFSKFCLRPSDERTNRYKTRNVVNTYLIVTFEDPFSNAPTLAKIKCFDFFP